jgi:hypothetical protein
MSVPCPHLRAIERPLVSSNVSVSSRELLVFRGENGLSLLVSVSAVLLGTLALDQHILVRIPGGQPSLKTSSKLVNPPPYAAQQ